MISVIFSTRSENFKSFGGLGKKFFLTCESLAILDILIKSYFSNIAEDFQENLMSLRKFNKQRLVEVILDKKIRKKNTKW